MHGTVVEVVRRSGADGGDDRRDDAVKHQELLGFVIKARYGLRGMFIGEASHPGPTARRRRRPRSSSVVDGWSRLVVFRRGTVVDPTTQFSQRMRTQVDGPSDDEPLIRPNSGRHVVPRMEPGQFVDVRDSAAHEQPCHDCEVSATVPDSSRVLCAAGLMGGATLRSRPPILERGGPATLQNRFAAFALKEDADAIPALQTGGIHNHPRWTATNKDWRGFDVLCRGSATIDPSWHRRNSSATGERIGFVDVGGEISREVRRLRWSVFMSH